jgi:hypothetical protein
MTAHAQCPRELERAIDFGVREVVRERHDVAEEVDAATSELAADLLEPGQRRGQSPLLELVAPLDVFRCDDGRHASTTRNCGFGLHPRRLQLTQSDAGLVEGVDERVDVIAGRGPRNAAKAVTDRSNANAANLHVARLHARRGRCHGERARRCTREFTPRQQWTTARGHRYFAASPFGRAIS